MEFTRKKYYSNILDKYIPKTFILQNLYNRNHFSNSFYNYFVKYKNRKIKNIIFKKT